MATAFSEVLAPGELSETYSTTHAPLVSHARVAVPACVLRRARERGRMDGSEAQTTGVKTQNDLGTHTFITNHRPKGTHTRALCKAANRLVHPRAPRHIKFKTVTGRSGTVSCATSLDTLLPCAAGAFPFKSAGVAQTLRARGVGAPSLSAPGR